MTVNVTRYLKNNTGSARYYLGTPIQPGQFFQIPTDKYMAYANLTEVVDDIVADHISVSLDGATTISDHNEQINALKGFSDEIPTDSDGAQFSRHKIAASGWHMEMYTVELETSKLNSVVDIDEDGNNGTFYTIKYYDGQEAELTSPTQADLDTNCTKTVVEFEPTWDYSLIGGQCRQQVCPTTPIRFFTVAVPDIPAPTGSVPFVRNENLEFLNPNEHLELDGRSPKKMLYDAVNHTNKLEFTFRHNAGVKHRIQISLELFRQ